MLDIELDDLYERSDQFAAKANQRGGKKQGFAAYNRMICEKTIVMPATLLLIVISVSLSSFSQLVLKAGMSSAPVQQALAGPLSFPATAMTVLFSPLVLTGLLCFGISAVFWMMVLSRVDLSYAYPCVALGIVFTVAAGHAFLGEPISAARILGLTLIVGGVSLVAFSR
ncbi:DMT family transporter [Terrihabitans sp. B22-R8]|uniref:DMT family transporter n=1 Tax=Terrihabitans sp. B22-R8 TaxID=3425128 RepID=UPI00403C7A46